MIEYTYLDSGNWETRQPLYRFHVFSPILECVESYLHFSIQLFPAGHNRMNTVLRRRRLGHYVVIRIVGLSLFYYRGPPTICVHFRYESNDLTLIADWLSMVVFIKIYQVAICWLNIFNRFGSLNRPPSLKHALSTWMLTLRTLWQII